MALGKIMEHFFCEENDSEQRKQTSVSGSWETVCAGTYSKVSWAFFNSVFWWILLLWKVRAMC